MPWQSTQSSFRKIQICNLQNGQLNGALRNKALPPLGSLFFSQHHNCGEEYVRKAFTNVNKQVTAVNTVAIYQELVS